MKTNIFISRTPLQLFNCIEVRDRFHFSENNFLFCVYKKEIDSRLMKTLLDGAWNKVMFIDLNMFSQQLYPIVLSSSLKNVGKVKNCYLGLPKHLGAHIVNSVSPENVTFVDDGNEIFKIANSIVTGEYEKQYSVPWRKRILGMKTSLKYCESALFFTMFNLEGFFPKDRILRNDYRCFKKRISLIEHTDDVWFIGSNILGQYITEKQTFVKYLEKVRHYYSGRNLYYAPHRYEDLAWLSRVASDLDIELVTSETILENAFLKKARIPKEIATFRSTALDTLAMLYNTSSCVFSINPEDLNSEEHKTEFSRLYSDYESRGIPVV